MKKLIAMGILCLMITSSTTNLVGNLRTCGWTNENSLIDLKESYNGLADGEDKNSWIKEGATFCEELILKTTTFNELADMIPILKDVGVKLIELVPIWEHCNSFAPGLRWQVRNYEKLDPARGTEEDLSNFLDKAHAAGLKVITMFQIATTTPPSPVCRGRVAPWAQTIDYDREGIGGYLYQYQIAHRDKDILVRNLDGEYACEFNGFGLVVNPQSEDVIRIFKELYEREINGRGFDGLRLDHPAISYCFSGDTIWHGCEHCLCPDPAVPGNYSPLRLYRTLRSIKKPDQVFTSEDPCTYPWISDWACNYPHYRPFTDMDEVADISEDYVFTLIILRHYVLQNKISSDEFVKWLNNEPISYGRTRYRMWRNWNMFDFAPINFFLNDPRYFPTVTLLCTIPGVPKVTQWEIIEEPPEELLDWLGIKEIKYPVEDRRAHWKKVLNIRNNNDALKYGSIRNIWKSGDETYAYLREYGEERVIVVINFLNREATSTLDLSFLENGTTLHDMLNNETFRVENPCNFTLSIPAYGSRILCSKENKPTVCIKKPSDGYLYILDREVIPTIFGNTIILGRITIEVGASDEEGIEKVEFYINGNIKFTDYNEPYSWLWNEFAMGSYEIKVIAYDVEGNEAEDRINVIALNFGGAELEKNWEKSYFLRLNL